MLVAPKNPHDDFLYGCSKDHLLECRGAMNALPAFGKMFTHQSNSLTERNVWIFLERQGTSACVSRVAALDFCPLMHLGVLSRTQTKNVRLSFLRWKVLLPHQFRDFR